MLLQFLLQWLSMRYSGTQDMIALAITTSMSDNNRHTGDLYEDRNPV